MLPAVNQNETIKNVVAPINPGDPNSAGAGGEQVIPGDQNNQAKHANNSWQLEYVSEDPALAREAFDAMEQVDSAYAVQTGCPDIDLQSLPQLLAHDSKMAGLAAKLDASAAYASETGNGYAAAKLLNDADMVRSKDYLLHNTEYKIEEEELDK